MAAAPTETSTTIGQKLTAAFWNTNVVTAVNFLLSPPLALLRQTGAQTIATATWTSILLDTEDLDRDGGHSIVTNTSRYTATIAGYYLCTGTVSWANATAGRRISRLAVNGTAVNGSASAGPLATGATAFTVVTSDIVYLNGTTDYVELQGFQDSGGNLNTNVAAEQASKLRVLWVSS